MLVREEMEYDLPTDKEHVTVRPAGSGPEINRSASDWVVHHIFSSLRVLASQQESSHAFLKNGGIAWASKVRKLTPELMAGSARVGRVGDDIKAIAQNRDTPQLVREALNMMQMATAHVLGTDGHRRLCRFEGNAYTTYFGPPLEFCTPNLADGKQCLLLVVQNEKIYLDTSLDNDGVVPKYRDMLIRLAKDPVGQTLVFHLVMRLFFQHVLGVRPDCIESRRGAKRPDPREWCTDGLAASACAPGIFGPIAAFRGEIEAQGRGSLHPHILVWLVLFSVGEVVDFLHRDPEQFQRSIYAWMKASIAATESVCQSSVRSLPRRFGDLGTQVAPLGFSATERKLSMYDGSSELDLLEVVPEHERSDAQKKVLEEEDPENWCRPCFLVRDLTGNDLSTSGEIVGARESVYGKSISQFAVGSCPAYRRRGPLRNSEEIAPNSKSGRCDGDASHESAEEITGTTQSFLLDLGPSDSVAAATTTKPTEGVGPQQWEFSFAQDVRKLAQEMFVHICGESCHKYSGKTVQNICRHGFYYIVNLGEWADRKEGISFRRRGKALRNSIFVVKQNKMVCREGCFCSKNSHSRCRQITLGQLPSAATSTSKIYVEYYPSTSGSQMMLRIHPCVSMRNVLRRWATWVFTNGMAKRSSCDSQGARQASTVSQSSGATQRLE